MRIIIAVLFFLSSFAAIGQTSYCPIPAGLTTSVTVVYATYNPLDKGVNISLSGGNLTQTTGGRGQVRSTKFCAIGTKHYWEVRPTVAGGGAGTDIGIATSAATIDNYTGQDATSYGWNSPGGVYNNGSIVTMGGNTFVTGDIVGIELDLVGNTLKYYKNNVLQGTITVTSANYYAADGSPSAGTGPSSITNYGATPFTYTGHVTYLQGIY